MDVLTDALESIHVTSLLSGRLELTAPWRAMLLEYHSDGPPATELGERERAWRMAAPPSGPPPGPPVDHH